MPVISGTTARQAEAIGRWLLMFLWVGGAVMWWWPGYRVWGSMAAGLIAVLGIWLAGQIVAGRRRVPGHPMHWGWLGPGAAMVWHLARASLTDLPRSDAGGVTASSAFHLVLLAAAVMLVQLVLSLELVNRPWTICGIALAMTVGGLAAWGSQAPVVTPATTLLGLAGGWLAVGAAWPGAWWGPMAEGALRRAKSRRWTWIWRGIVGVLAAAGATALAAEFTREALVSAACLGLALLGAGALGTKRRWLFLAAGAAVTAGAATALRAWGGWGLQWPSSWLGEGDNIFSRVHTDAGGLTVLGGMLGWVGLGGLGLALVGTVARLWRLGGSCQARETIARVAWTAGTLTACAAVAAPGGLFVPSTVLAVGLAVGLMPAAFGAGMPERPAWVLGGAVAGAAAVLGLSSAGGLARWAPAAIGGEDAWPHALTGFLLAMILAWWWGARRTWLALAGVGLVVLIGAGGELAQQWFTREPGEWHDWGFHTLGCLPAVIVLVLGRYARRCELPDARAKDLVSGSHRWRALPRRARR
ncbi:MAG: hypothetical protein NT031_10205 [Planctomycetota bacterium]|nr:hypothetical protein [Planctomycetota bacterium]